MEGLIQILEYFPDKLKVNDITAEQKKFVLAALNSVSRNIDSFLSLMPADEVGLTLTLTLILTLALALALALILALTLTLTLTLTLALALALADEVGPSPQTEPRPQTLHPPCAHSSRPALTLTLSPTLTSTLNPHPHPYPHPHPSPRPHPKPATRHQVKAAKDQIEEENRLNLAELPEDVKLLNPPKVDGAEDS